MSGMAPRIGPMPNSQNLPVQLFLKRLTLSTCGTRNQKQQCIACTVQKLETKNKKNRILQGLSRQKLSDPQGNIQNICSHCFGSTFLFDSEVVHLVLAVVGILLVHRRTHTQNEFNCVIMCPKPTEPKASRESLCGLPRA